MKRMLAIILALMLARRTRSRRASTTANHAIDNNLTIFREAYGKNRLAMVR